MKEKLKVFSNGLLKENPSLRLVLGTCPTLAVTTLAVNGLGMGLAATFVLVCSNIAISALRKIIPDKVRLPAYITVIATFVTVLQMLVKAFVPALDSALGIFLPLIVVNCIILGRAEMFASKNSIGLSALDGLGMGLGFTGTLVVMGSVREVLGAGTLFGVQVMPAAVDPMTVFITPPGGFFVFGCLMALVIWIEIKTNNRKVRSIGCEGCPSASVCGGKCADNLLQHDPREQLRAGAVPGHLPVPGRFQKAGFRRGHVCRRHLRHGAGHQCYLAHLHLFAGAKRHGLSADHCVYPHHRGAGAAG